MKQQGRAENRIEKLKKTSAAWAERRPTAALVLLAAATVMITEVLSRHSFPEAVAFLLTRPMLFAVNMLIVLSTLALAGLSRRKSFWQFAVTLCWLLLALTDFVLRFLRTSPFTFDDILLLPSCLSVVKVYLSGAVLILVAACALALAVMLVMRYRKAKVTQPDRKKQLPKAAAACFATAVLLFAMMHITEVNGLFRDVADAYSRMGFVYGFTRGIYDRGIRKPQEYSEENMADLLDDIGNEEQTEEIAAAGQNRTGATTERPNIILLQLESFFDVKRIKGLEFSEDPVPVFTGLKKTCPSGYLSVPSVGAGTANTEFEVLTGMNLDHFGAGEYPYKTILQEKTCESVAYDLKGMGYATWAIHNNIATFYNRNLVYPNLGFDRFTSLEYMQAPEKNLLGWAKDSVLTDEILGALKATPECDLVFAVSVQAHGRYPDTIEDSEENEENFFNLFLPFGREAEAEEDTAAGHHTGSATAVLNAEMMDGMKIRVSGAEDEETETQYTYYANQLYEVDSFLADLISSLSLVNEPTLLVLYGDHLPAFGYTADDLADGTTPYESEYVIWSNMNLPFGNKDLEAWQLAAYALGEAGIHEGTLSVFHQKYSGEEDYDEKLKMLEYDMLYGDMETWNGENPYLPAAMQMGTRPIEIYGITKLGERVYITGRGFTEFSGAMLDGKRVETEFVSGGKLYVDAKQWDEEASILTVEQTDGDGEQLSVTEAFRLG